MYACQPGLSSPSIFQWTIWPRTLPSLQCEMLLVWQHIFLEEDWTSCWPLSSLHIGLFYQHVVLYWQFWHQVAACLVEAEKNYFLFFWVYFVWNFTSYILNPIACSCFLSKTFWASEMIMAHLVLLSWGFGSERVKTYCGFLTKFAAKKMS